MTNPSWKLMIICAVLTFSGLQWSNCQEKSDVKVHDGWAWINVVPLNPKGEVEGEEWPSLLQEKDGKWIIIDLIAIAEELDDPVGPMEPNAKFLAAVKKHYPDVPSDIFPKATE